MLAVGIKAVASGQSRSRTQAKGRDASASSWARR